MSDWVKKRIRTVPDFPKKGIQFRDVTTLMADAKGFRRAVDVLVQTYIGVDIDKVAGIEARGFILGGAVAHQLATGFVPIRKPGKLPYKTLGQDYLLEYGRDRLEMHQDAVRSGDLVLLVDDLIATGGTAEAAVKLIREAGGTVAAACFLVDLPDLGGSRKIRDMGVDVITLADYAGE